MKQALLILLMIALTGAAAAPAPTGRPLWWRVSDGRSVLWVLGVPNGMLTNLAWDDTAMRKRVAAADRVYYPLLDAAIRPTSGVTSHGFIPTPFSFSTRPVQALNLIGSAAFDPYAPGKAARALPAALQSRFQRVAAPIDWEAPGRFRDQETWKMAAWLDMTNWPTGALGNPVAWRLFTLTPIGKPITQIEVNRAIFPQINRDHTPPEAVQDACLVQVLDQTKSGQIKAARQAAMEAWARGDLDHALKRSSDLPLCLMGQQKTTDAAAFFERQAYIYYNALDETFDKGGSSVTVVAFDPLLSDNGVLAHYRALGYQISLSDGME